MKILISNDDGYFSPGIETLFEALRGLGEITVVAPERDRSGASNSLTLDRPLIVRQAANGFFFVNGTPSDCVHLAITGLLQEKPDLIVSGINHGANMGDDTIYSGTVAAAMEGYLFGIPAMAFSIVNRSPAYLASAAKIAFDLVARFASRPLSNAFLLNINVPDQPLENIQGIQVTRLGKRHAAEPMIPTTTPRGHVVYWLGNAGLAQDAGEGTDFHAISGNFVSLTPLRADLTHYDALQPVQVWLDGQ
jgi:5'-nucleotidase